MYIESPGDSRQLYSTESITVNYVVQKGVHPEHSFVFEVQYVVKSIEPGGISTVLQ
jgi:hypothetical protein